MTEFNLGHNYLKLEISENACYCYKIKGIYLIHFFTNFVHNLMR